MAQKDLAFDIIARDRASATNQRIGDSFGKMKAATVGAFAGMGAAVGKFAIGQLGNAARMVKDFVVDGVKQFADFDRSMREVWTLLPDMSDAAFKDLQGDVRAFIREMGVAHDEAVPALYQAISAGVPQDNVLEFMTTAAKFAIGGITPLETAVDGLTSVVNAYGAEVISAQEASDIFFETVRLGKTDAGQLSSSLFQVIPTAAALKVGFGEVGAALAAITAQGVPTSVATTQLRQLFVELNKESSATAKLFREDIAGKSFPEFIAQGGTVAQALQLMRDHADDNNTSISNLFGSVEAGNAALSLTSDVGMAKFLEALDEMQSASGATDSAFAKMDEGIGRTWDKLMIRFNDLKIAVGEKLAPAIESVLDWLDQLTTEGDLTSESINRLAKGIESDVDERITPALDRFGEKMGVTLVEQEGAIGSFMEFATRMWEFWIDNWGRAADAVVFFKDSTVFTLDIAQKAVLGYMEFFVDAAAKAFGWIPGLGPKLRNTQEKFREFRDRVNGFLAGIRTNVNVNVQASFSRGQAPAGMHVPQFHSGGEFNSGRGEGLALLRDNEIVMNPAASQRNAAALHAMNSGATVASGGAGGTVRVVLDVQGGEESLVRALREMLKPRGGVMALQAR